jgi:hypothetical protein
LKIDLCDTSFVDSDKFNAQRASCTSAFVVLQIKSSRFVHLLLLLPCSLMLCLAFLFGCGR